MCLDVVLCMLGCLMLVLDKSPRLIVRGVIWILAFDNVFVNSTNISTNIETAMRLVVAGANANDYLRTSAVRNINS